jgi:hypothetical protein
MLLQPREDQIEQLLHRLTAMTAGDLLVQMPPYTLNRICLRRVGGEVMEHPAAKIALHGLTVMDTGMVTDDMDFPVTQQPVAQVAEMADEQSRRAALRFTSETSDKLFHLPSYEF